MDIRNIIVTHIDGVCVPLLNNHLVLYCGEQQLDNVNWIKENSLQYHNIHYLNKCFCETTAIWFAWKNYERISDPKFLQISHYRRTLDCKDYYLYDIVYNNPMSVSSVKCQMNSSHEFIKNNYDKIMERINERCPKYYQLIENGMNCNKFYLKNLFIMKKNVFFDFCQFSFDIFDNVLDMFPTDSRDGSFFMERITSCFIFDAIKYKKTKGVDAICN